MLNIKSLITGVAAAALVSSIGLVYAQSTTYPPAANDTQPAATSPAPMEPATNAAPSDTPMPGAAPSGAVAEPAPKADRN
jgi:hypothetical protein